jgi:NADH-quinone oxidoreductase subunit H
MSGITIVIFVVKALWVLTFAMGLATVLTWVDRRGGAMFQDRVGPHRAVFFLPRNAAQALAVLPALLVAAGVVTYTLTREAHGADRMFHAEICIHLAIFSVWATGMVVARQIRHRGIKNSFDNFIASLGDPRRMLYIGLAVHAAVLLAGLMFRRTPVGSWLAEIGYASGPAVFAGVVLGAGAYCWYAIKDEDRVGIRLAGLLHPMADGLKTIVKEDLVPPKSDRLLHGLAPFISFFPVLVLMAIVPFGDTLCFGTSQEGAIELGKLLPSVPREGVCVEGAVPLQVVDLNVGLLYFFAIAGTGVVGAALAGWSSDNKFSLLGGLRAASQMVSYEVTLGLTLVGALMIYGTLQMDQMVQWQAENAWGIFVQPFAFVLFLAAAIAESKRVPFDLPEGESEIVAGYFTEYSGMKFTMFFFSEYIAVVVSSAVMATIFLGGWHVPFLERDGLMLAIGDSVLFSAQLSHGTVILLGVITFICKVLVLCWVQAAIRWTLPRFRYDQLMRLGWRMLLPASLVNVLATGLIILGLQAGGPQTQKVLSAVGDVTMAVVLVADVVVTVLFVRFLLAPPQKRRLVASSAARLIAQVGGLKSTRMGA